MAGRPQELPAFEDVAVFLSRAEWELAAEEQRELYRAVMLDNFALLTSLGYAGPKPDLLYRLEHGEEPWVCTPQGSETWDGPDSPSLGCNGDSSCPEEPGFTWWPSPGRQQALEESTEPPSHAERCDSPSPGLCSAGPKGQRRAGPTTLSAGGQSEPWQLRCSRLLKKFSDPGGKEHTEAASGQTPPAGSPERAEAGSQTEKDQVEDEEGAKPGINRGTELPLDPEPQAQPRAADPCEPLGAESQKTSQGSVQEAQRAEEDGSLPLAAGDVDGAPLGDHCYYTRQGAVLQPALREHDYCGDSESRALVMKDHDYCQALTSPQQGCSRKGSCPVCRAHAMLRKRKLRKGGANGKGTRVKQRLGPFFKSMRISQEYLCADCLFTPTVPAVVQPAEAQHSTKDTTGAFRLPAEWHTVILQPQQEGDSVGGTPEAPRGPAASPEPSAGEAWGGAAQPKVWVRYRARGWRPPRLWWDLARQELIAPSQASLCNACDGALRTRNWALCTACLCSAVCGVQRGRPHTSQPAPEHRSPVSSAQGNPPRGLHRRFSESCSEGSGA
uniref:KRAB domain-containing protein n=1 Tax=Anas zonorhyncha TaxID=75864 RepID=A0A8B9V8V5_9AVES